MVQLVNKTVEIKEELFYQTRKSHGVDVRSGKHVPRTDAADYEAALKILEDTKAHLKIKGRTFGDLDLPENLFDDKIFDRAQFYRWITGKNEEATAVIKAKQE